jgi:hypothetical protein
MKHPFALNPATELETEQTALVVGGAFSQMSTTQYYSAPNDGKAQELRVGIITPVKPPIAFTQAIGEDGGHLPEPDLL